MAMQKKPGCDTDTDTNQEAIISLHETISSLQSEIDALEKADVIVKFCSIAGTDRSTAESLWQAGFRSIESLASSAPEQIDEECQISLSECKRIVAVAVARKKIEEEESLHNEIDDLFEETEPVSLLDVAAFDDENHKAAVSPQLTDNTSEENPGSDENHKAAVSPQLTDNTSEENPGSDENHKAVVSPQLTDNASVENSEIVMFRRRLARMIVKELF